MGGILEAAVEDLCGRVVAIFSRDVRCGEMWKEAAGGKAQSCLYGASNQHGAIDTVRCAAGLEQWVDV
jgi:hypothetical protein